MAIQNYLIYLHNKLIMNPTLYYPQNSRTTPYTTIPKQETHTPPTYFANFSPVSPKMNQEIYRADQRVINNNFNPNNNNTKIPTYVPPQIKPYKLEHAFKAVRSPAQKTYGNNLDMSYPRYGDMKNSYIGPDARQVVHSKQIFNEHLKAAKKLPRLSQPNYFPNQSDTNQNSDKISENTQETTSIKKKAFEDTSIKNNMIYTPNKKLDFEERQRMRKSSFDPTQSWSKNTPKKKPQKKITLNDFEKIKQLGTGKYGKVFLVRQKTTQYICALKIIQKQMLKQQQITQQFIRQLKIQMFLNHPNIVKMYGFFEDTANIYIILQVALGGQLYKQLKRGTSMPQVKVANIMRQVVAAVNQLHSNQIIHRDIKPQNIVLNQNVVKLCDFGWSVYHGQTLRTTFCGTPLYVSPQILKGNNYDEKIDIWSLGIMMYEMLVGENPFKITQQQQLIKIIKDTVAFPSFVNISNQAKDFVHSCLQKNPNDRANIRQLVNHQFFKKYPQKDKKMTV